MNLSITKMQSIFNLLNKIKWSKKENKNDYAIYYYDRICKNNKEIKFKDIKEFDKLFITTNKNKKEINIPLHRIKIVKKKGNIIWTRLF